MGFGMGHFWVLRTWGGKTCSTQIEPPSFHLLKGYHFGSVDDKPNQIPFMGNTALSPHPPLGHFLPNPKLKFLDQCREVMRFKQLAYRSEETYLQWIRRFILFHRRKAVPARGVLADGHRPRPTFQKWVWRHPRDMGEAEVRAFLTDLAVTRRVGAATQNQDA